MCRPHFIVISSIIAIVFLDGCKGIIQSNEERPKPTYTPGIKTARWKNHNVIQTHHNYSKVLVHNKPDGLSQYVVTQADKTQKVFPVYNAHSYGQPGDQQNIVGEKNPLSTQGYSASFTQGVPMTNRTIYKRKIRYKTVEVYEKCPEDATGQFVYYLSCNQFLNCWKGRGQPQNCSPGTLFNPNSLECDFPDKVECITGPRENTLEGMRSQKSTSQPTCPTEFVGLMPNYTDCSKFVNCNNGQHFSMDCPPGTLFDIDQNICDFTYKATCFNGQSNQEHQGHTADQYKYDSNTYGGQNYQQSGMLHPRYSSHEKIGTNSWFVGSYAPSQVYQGHRQPYQGQPQAAQGQPGYKNTQGSVHGNGQQNTQFYGSYTGYNRHNIDSKLDFDQVGQPNRPAVPTHNSFSQTYSQGNPNCNSQSCQGQQNTQYQSQGGHRGQTNGFYIVRNQRCNPQLENCGVQQGGTYPHQSHNQDQLQGHSVSNNFNQGQGVGQTQGQTAVRAQGQDQPPVTGNQQSGGYYYTSGQGGQQVTYIGNQGQTQNVQGQAGNGGYYRGSGQICDPKLQNCGYGAGIITQSQGRTTASPNYNKICNINDPNCHTSGAKPKKEAKCPKDFQGITRHPEDCAKFLNCANGLTFVQDCAPGTLFNPLISVCDFPYNVKCTTGDDGDVTTITAPKVEVYQTTDSYWQTRYEENARKYGQNAGQGNIREGTEAPPFQVTTPYNQGQTQGYNSYGQGQATQTPDIFRQNQGQSTYPHNQNGYNQSQNAFNQGQQTNPQTQNSQTNSQGQNFYNRDGASFTSRPKQTTIVSSQVGQSAIGDVDVGQIGVVSRPAPKPTRLPDYPDVVVPDERKNYNFRSTSPRSVDKAWPPQFPSTDVNADYVFEYDDGEPVTLEPQNVFYSDKKRKTVCSKEDFYCSSDACISKTMVCDGYRDCPNGKDELNCEEYLDRFALRKNHRLDVMEKQRWVNVSHNTCALLCVQTTRFSCRSFNYRKIDKTCFLTDSNVGLSGALVQYYPFDYYELKSGAINCSNLFKCHNDKCITTSQLCDGFDDCGDRQDEKNCKPSDFGYSSRLVGTQHPSEGRIEVTAFGKTGYICDDNFGIDDANVLCKELGYPLGAAEIRGNSYYAKDLKENNTLYMMDDLDCFGNESTLLDCNFLGWGIHNCRDQEIAGVLCKTPQGKCGKGYWKCDSGNECVPLSFVCDGLFDCTDNSDEGAQHCEAPVQMRLVNGSSKFEGRIEIKHHGIWGTICDDDFNEDAAKVTCKYFGFKGAAYVKKDAYFGPGEGPIWLDQVSCYGNETELEACTHWNYGEHNCDHTEDVGVICSDDLDVIEIQRNSRLNEGQRTSTRPPPVSCGFRKDNQFLENDLIHARVVSGSLARKGDYPWQAALRVKGKGKSAHWCGAVVISSKWVITAAHCLQGYAKGAYVVVAGEYNTDEEEGTEQQKYIEEYFIHENFRKGHKMNNDIALIKLKGTGFMLNEDVQPICLPDIDTNYEKELNCTISGFGSVKSGTSAYSHNMMAAWIPIHKSEICKMPHVYGTALTGGDDLRGVLGWGRRRLRWGQWRAAGLFRPG
ncbi:hypothetical protein NQ317_013521 [Molorchus minor]|uniref:Uncharacterized protein n=1 Tax=Molorchus minor TaxID=1323400 RepID=A0ABQ9JVW3_9CUCU|nr:hypothetical protein NQ317_013521 [Molorchus minor]